VTRRVRLRVSDLDDLCGRGVRVAVVDSGVHAAHPHVQGVQGGVGICADGAEQDDYVDRLGHGTAVAAAIREKAPAAELLAVKVFDRELSTTGAALAAALAWARRARTRLVNLSLGTTNRAHEAALGAEIDAAVAGRVIVVAARPTPDARWLPGALPGVVAVELDMSLERDACDVEVARDGRIVVRACGLPRPIPGVPPERNLRGPSFAVANASGLLARALEAVSAGMDVRAAFDAILARAGGVR
jgi:hypothetical protein